MPSEGSNMNDLLYVGVFRITPTEERDQAGAVHRAFLTALKEQGSGTVPGEILIKEFEADPEIACQPENSGKYVMANDHDALCKLGLSFEAANRLVPVVTEAVPDAK